MITTFVCVSVCEEYIYLCLCLYVRSISIVVCVFVGEEYLGVSGVLATVVLGVTMNSEKTMISPEVEHFLHR